MQKPQDFKAIKFRLGGEYKYHFNNSDFGGAIRGGVDDGAPALGAGVSFKQLSLDYACMPEKVRFLGESRRFSLTGHF